MGAQRLAASIAQVALVLLVSLGAALACGVDPDRSQVESLETRLEAALTKTFEDGVAPACGADVAHTAVSEVVVVNERICLGCREVGWFLRRRARVVSRDRLVVVAPAEEISTVCDYLRREKVLLAVLPLKTGEDPGDLPSADALAVYRIDSLGLAHYRATARDGVALLSLLAD